MPYTVTKTAIDDVLILEPKVFGAGRGYFFESFNSEYLNQTTELDVCSVQDNHSRSAKDVLGGLHYQVRQPQGKQVRFVRGAVFEVTVGILKSSKTVGKWVGVELTEENHQQLGVPTGFAHGFLVLSDAVDFLYKTTDYCAEEHERCIAWTDPELQVKRTDQLTPRLSAKEKAANTLKVVEVFE